MAAISFYDLALEMQTLCFRKAILRGGELGVFFFFKEECQKRMCTHSIETTAVIEKSREQKQ